MKFVPKFEGKLLKKKENRKCLDKYNSVCSILRMDSNFFSQSAIIRILTTYFFGFRHRFSI